MILRLPEYFILDVKILVLLSFAEDEDNDQTTFGRADSFLKYPTEDETFPSYTVDLVYILYLEALVSALSMLESSISPKSLMIRVRQRDGGAFH